MAGGRPSRVPESVVEPDLAPGKDEVEDQAQTRDKANGKGKGKGKAVEGKPHSPFIGFAAGICSG